MWYQKRFFEKIVTIILVLFVIYLAYLLLPVLSGVTAFLVQILIPAFLSLILYYLLRPLVQYLQKKIGLYAAIGVAFLVTAIILFVLGVFIYPAIMEQVKIIQSIDLKEMTKSKSGSIFGGLNQLSDYFTEELRQIASSTLSYLHVMIVENITWFISIITQFFFTLIIVPFVLFYLLKDGKKMHDAFIERVPKKYTPLVETIAEETDQALFQFINGRVVIAAITATMLYICFMLIGLDYAIVLTLISFLFYIIPTIGNFLAMILPLLVGFTMSTWMGFEVLIIMLVISSIEGFLISTLVMGATLYIHPLTLLLILLAAGAFYGMIGLLFAAPVYVIGKIVFLNCLEFYREQKKKA
jgi:predicted PurR-regulated permease PerM